MQHLAIHPRDADVSGESLFWDNPPHEALARSLAEMGQLVPALAEIVDDRPRILAGRARVLALRRLPGRTLDARIIAWPGPDCGHSPEVWRGLVYLASNMGRAIDEAMLVKAGRYFSAFVPAPEFVRLAGPYLGPALASGSRRLTDWLSLPEKADELLFTGTVPLAGAQALAGMDREDLDALWPWLTAARWSANTLARFVTPLREAARASGRSLSETADTALAGVGADQGLSPNDLIARLSAAAKSARYPVLTDLEERFAALSRGISRGTAFTLHPSRGFESDAVTLELRAADAATLRQAAADLARMAAHPDWQALWSLARGQEAHDASPGGDGGGDRNGHEA
ncbi:chromosome partitioning protein ParB [Desulfovibrio sulfodismutans]|uniref:Chromosome partitioning protein ParB n=1 Tax=Desulfolutivibrio sulfodismutans TaxID=63561 RepID=A0A7K3NJQ9_9BACT|nr:chromosome partitioning protein ParB [Desulfolutivibrio sulfodismutans]NDY56410.1 chromosome partitioning protein ParB [Desulfolutivibrio sulfodismutans]QLA13827.1 chromosome partitioning protein ParB [Desulfolutivibrio sulfodismutans DSM 3696]